MNLLCYGPSPTVTLAMVPSLTWNFPGMDCSMPCPFPYNGSFEGMTLPWHELPLAWIFTFSGPYPDSSLL